MYESFYGLKAKPFQLSPDPAFFYGSRGHSSAMAYLEYGLHQSEGFIVVTGEVGAGKTTLVKSLLRKIDTSRVVAGQIVSANLDADDILRMVSGAFGLPYEHFDKAALLLSLEKYFLALHRDGRRALLVVDEAQQLTPRAVEELRMLSNFQSAERSLLQTFLLGQPEFRQMMASPYMQQLRQRVIASYHLGPLDADETREYIEHRLKVVGWTGNPAFDPEAYAAVHEFAAGIPRRINTLCDRLMLAGFLAQKTMISAADVKEVTEEFAKELAVAPAVEPITAAAAGLSPSGAAQAEQQAAAARAGASGGSGAATAPFGGAGAVILPLEPRGAERAHERAAEDPHLAELDTRVSRMERAVDDALGLLRQILSVIRPNGKSEREPRRQQP